MSPIENILSFIVEIEKLKGVLRKTKPVGLERYENSAEHSWHVCISALMLKDYANDEINIDRVIKMLLIHDLCEIDAGDTIIYASETKAVKKEEYAGLKRILNLLPPILHNLHGNAHSWRDNNISENMIMDVNSRIAKGSSELWATIRAQLEIAFDSGILKK